VRIVALDTTSEFGSIAIVDGGRILEEVLLHSPDGFGHVLYGHLARLLDNHGWTIHGVKCFAAAAGPGSFTGVRVGLAAVKGLAEAAGIRAAGISNLQALATFGEAPLRATILDARRGEVYAALYNEHLEPVLPETVSEFQSFLAALPDREVEFISTDFAPFRIALGATRFATARVTDGRRALAGAVGLLAERSGGTDPAAIDANYVRRSDAELFWRD
jgi:tRNA threonylcarbamoyladenosine biosynthesis protein TsaB